MRSKKALLNMSSSLLYEVVALICGLITPRLLLTAFGSTYNGVVSSAAQFLSMVNLLTLGITASTRVALYKTLARDDALGTSRLMKALKSYMRKVALCVLLVAGVLCVAYPFISHNDLTPAQNAALIAIVSIGTFAEYFFGISNRTLLQAAQSSYISSVISIAKVIANTVCVVILIRLGCSIYTVKLGSSLVYLAAPAILSLYIKKKFSLTSRCEPDNTGIKERKAVAFHSIANLVHNNTDLVVLTFFTDAKVISVYTVYYLVVGKLKTLMGVFTSGMEAAFGDMWVRGELQTLQKRFRTYEYLLFTFTAVVFSCMAVLILPFVEVYTRGITDVNYIRPGFAALLVAAEGLHCIRQPYLTLVYATGSFEQTKWGAAIEAGLNIVISVVLVNFIGISGVILGTLVANGFRTVQFAYFVSRNILKRSIWEVAARLCWLLACMLLCIGAGMAAKGIIVMPLGWMGWLVRALASGVLSVTIVGGMSFLFYRKDILALLKTGLGAIKKQ